MSGKYDDIINLPHHISQKHPQMPVSDRAAQFAPFAALTGHDAAIQETARLTADRIELGEDARAELDLKQQLLHDMLSIHPEITVTYFKPDERKSGGAYLSFSGQLKDINDTERLFIFNGGIRLSADQIISIDGDIFRETF